MKYVVSEALSLMFGAVIAVCIMLAIDNGTFLSLYNELRAEVGGSGFVPTTIIRTLPGSVSSRGGTGAANQAAAPVSTLTQNWAGYEAAGGSYTAIGASWTVPSVAASGPNAADATWVGIGGSGTSDLIQIGTENTIVGGRDQLVAFYETLPAYAQPIQTVELSPGDTVSAHVTETAPGVWSLTLQDLSNGESFRTSVDYASANASAEWIQEAPSSTTSIMPLDNFGSVSFSGATVTAGGVTETIAASGAEAITMENASGQMLTTVSTLTAAGNGFTVTRTSAPAGAGGGLTFRREPGFRRFGT